MNALFAQLRENGWRRTSTTPGWLHFCTYEGENSVLEEALRGILFATGRRAVVMEDGDIVRFFDDRDELLGWLKTVVETDENYQDTLARVPREYLLEASLVMSQIGDMESTPLHRFFEHDKPTSIFERYEIYLFQDSITLDEEGYVAVDGDLNDFMFSQKKIKISEEEGYHVIQGEKISLYVFH